MSIEDRLSKIEELVGYLVDLNVWNHKSNYDPHKILWINKHIDEIRKERIKQPFSEWSKGGNHE